MSRQDTLHPEDLPRDAELSRLYREYAHAEPPAGLDDVILDAARRDLERRQPRSASPWWRGWLAPVSLFATVVLTFTLTLLVHQERQREELPAAPEASTPAPPRQESPAASPARPAVPDAKIDSVAPKRNGASPPAPARPAERERDGSRADSAASAGNAEQKQKHKRAREVRDLPAAEAPAERRGVDTAPAAAPPLTVPEAFPGSAKEESSARRAPVAAESQAAREGVRHEMRKATPSAPAAAMPGENSRLQARPQAPLKDKVEQGISAGAGVGSAPPDGERSGSMEQTLRSPQAWIEEIRALRRQGREREALEAIERFRRAYPDFVLPEDLR